MTLQHKQSSAHEVIIVGAGSSGLSLAFYLLKRGIRPLILDAAPEVASSWRKRHPQLSLNTHRVLSKLPDMCFPRRQGVFVRRDEFIAYLERYVVKLETQYKVKINFNQEVTAIDRVSDGWQVKTQSASYLTSQLVIATGPDKVPYMPKWLGIDKFKGSITHAIDFGEVSQYDDKDVLIIGGANSGIDLANHLVRRG